MKIIFFGTPPFAVTIFRYLIEHNIDIVAVVTKPDSIQGRSGKLTPPALKIEVQNECLGIPIYQPIKASEPEFAPILESHNADLFVVVAYGEIIKQHLLDMPRLGCINVHASLLPKYRGAAPIQRSIINGEIETGVTIMHLVKKMDAGDIIKTVKVPITPNMTFGELHDFLSEVGKKALLQVINDFQKGIVHRTSQDESQATYAPKIEPEECQIDWTKSAQDIHNLIRGVTPHPGAWCLVQIQGHDQPKRLKIAKSHVLKNEKGKPGEILSHSKDGIVVACGKECVCIGQLQLEGKKALPATEFVLGHPHFAFL